MNNFIGFLVAKVAEVGTHWLMPTMCLMFVAGAFIRLVVFFTTKCEHGFALEFEKRVYAYLADPDKKSKGTSFHQVTRTLLERTYREHFELKQKFKRRRFDHITSITDRLFLIQAGALRLVSDTLSQTKYLQKDRAEPRFLDISKFVFGSNPIFNKIFGVLPIGVFHDTINILPGIFVIGGIFGTFLGTMGALPALSNLDPGNVEITKSVMDGFLMHITYSMGCSVLGIALSVIMTFLNTICSPEGMYLTMVSKYTSSLEFLWNDTETNEVGSESMDIVDPRTGRPHVEPAGPIFRLPWKKKGDKTAPATVVNNDTQELPKQDSATANALRDRIAMLDRMIHQTESEKGALSPDAWGEQLRYLREEKKKVESDLAYLLAKSGKAA